jgi:hypothetical protein
MCEASTDRTRASRDQSALQGFDPISITDLSHRDFKAIKHAHRGLNSDTSLDIYTNIGFLEPGKCG